MLAVSLTVLGRGRSQHTQGPAAARHPAQPFAENNDNSGCLSSSETKPQGGKYTCPRSHNELGTQPGVTHSLFVHFFMQQALLAYLLCAGHWCASHLDFWDSGVGLRPCSLWPCHTSSLIFSCPVPPHCFFPTPGHQAPATGPSEHTSLLPISGTLHMLFCLPGVSSCRTLQESAP